MKKEIVAVVLLLLILAGNIWNRQRLDKVIEELNSLTEEAYAFSKETDWTEAEDYARSAEEAWLSAHNYTHIFIRHSDVDTLTAALCDYHGAIVGRDDGDILASYLRLSASLHCLQYMETLSVGSIF